MLDEKRRRLTPNTIEDPLPRLPFPDRATLFIVRSICTIGLLLANYYSWTMTVTGFVNTQYLPDNTVVPNTYIPHIVAGFVQLGILAFYLTIPYFQKRRFVVLLFASILAITLVCLSSLFALFSITMTSQSHPILDHHIALLKGMNKKIIAIDDLISNTFTSHLGQLVILSENSREGKDRTAIAVCGPLCKGYIGDANDLRHKYASRLEPRQPYATMATTDIMDSVTSLNGNHVKLSQKVRAYNRFLVEVGLSDKSVFKAFDDLTAEMTSYAASLNQRNPDTKLLVLIRVLSDLERLVTQRADPTFVFAVTISFLPDILSIMFVALLHLVRFSNERALTMRRAVRQAYEEAKWYGKMSAATDTLRRSKESWRTSRRSANISEDVDRSVPDTIGSTMSA